MSLVKKPTMTERKVAANQQNGSISQGATTEEGKECIGAAQLRHDFYAKMPEVARRLLGEGGEKVQGGHDLREKKDSYRPTDKISIYASI